MLVIFVITNVREFGVLIDILKLIMDIKNIQCLSVSIVIIRAIYSLIYSDTRKIYMDIKNPQCSSVSIVIIRAIDAII